MFNNEIIIILGKINVVENVVSPFYGINIEYVTTNGKTGNTIFGEKLWRNNKGLFNPGLFNTLSSLKSGDNVKIVLKKNGKYTKAQNIEKLDSLPVPSKIIPQMGLGELLVPHMQQPALKRSYDPRGPITGMITGEAIAIATALKDKNTTPKDFEELCKEASHIVFRLNKYIKETHNISELVLEERGASLPNAVKFPKDSDAII